MSELATAIRAFLDAHGLTVIAACRRGGMSRASMDGVLAGKLPNALTIKKYAKLLGISVNDVRKMGGNIVERKKVIDGSDAFRHAIASMQKADAILRDRLALEVHDLDPAKRKTIQAVLSSMRA